MTLVSLRRGLLVLFPLFLAAHAQAATPLNLQVLGRGYSGTGALPQFHVGEVLTLSVKVPAKVGKGISWPHVKGLTDNGSGFDTGPNFQTFNYFVTPARAGAFTIPGFDIHADNGQSFHVGALAFRVGK